MARHTRALERYSVLPDTQLKELYGKTEARRHYIDLEYFGSRRLDALGPDLDVMERRFGTMRVLRAGTLPWTIEDVSAQLEAAWTSGDCDRVLPLSGYLAHYVGDMSQPLHTTERYDGEFPSDKGMHARLERAVDRSVARIDELARPEVHVVPIVSAWDSTIAGLRESNALVGEVFKADREARTASGGDEQAYTAILMNHEDKMIAGRIADSASRLASIWIYEWQQAGRPMPASPEPRRRGDY